jgi:hypothetical protein
MNIKDAKNQIKNSVKIYLSKNEFGQYAMPIERQRPLFLLGAPGIGKTDIIAQVANELDIALVSYSMTHHTRQSALGLPYISHKSYAGSEFDVSEYTMSEIIASVYESIESSGMKEGILFLDEINCVSETLAPSMLQFLQFKIFGRHRIPDGWVVVTAGNPPEYNKSVREFDIVTLDRLKILEVEGNYEVWKEHAAKSGVHGAVLSFLDINNSSDFYKAETTVKGKEYVTARGWSDLSDAMKLYEKEDIAIDDALIGQYLRSPQISKKFSQYFNLYNKYKDDYKVIDIMNGARSSSIIRRAKAAPFDERLSLVGLMIESLRNDMREHVQAAEILGHLVTSLRTLKESPGAEGFNKQLEKHQLRLSSLKAANTISRDNERILGGVIKSLKDYEAMYEEKKEFKPIKQHFDKRVKQLETNAASINSRLHNAFDFTESVFGEGQEMLIFVTEMTSDYYLAKFINMNGSDDYFKHNKELQFDVRRREIETEIKLLDLGA